MNCYIVLGGKFYYTGSPSKQQRTQFVFQHIFFYFNNICIVITPTCFDISNIILRQFQSFTSLKLRSFNVIKFSLMLLF
jgi:hypothetical protein